MQDLRGNVHAVTESRIVGDTATTERRGLRVQVGMGQNRGFDVLVDNAGTARFIAACFERAAERLAAQDNQAAMMGLNR